MNLDDTEETRPGKFARAFCALSIAAVSGAIIHNAVFAQQSRVFSDSRISISADSTRLDKLFSVLNINDSTDKPGRTRVSVQPVVAGPALQSSPADAAVMMAQQQLADLGAFSGQTDGLLGQDTRDVIMRYQRANGLALTGKPDPQFLEHLQYLHHIHQASTLTGSIAPDVDHQAVERAQRELQKLGYDPGPVDGKMGSKTTQAIRQFQADLRLPPDGKLSPELLDKLAPAKTSQVE